MAEFVQTPFPEIISRHILPRLPVSSILALCASSAQYRHWCQDETLWAEIAQRDYPGTQRLLGQSWLGLIQEMQERRLIPVGTGEIPTWQLVISKGMNLANLAFLVLHLPYVLAILDRQIPLTLTAVRQAAAQLGISPVPTALLGSNYNYSRAQLPEGPVAGSTAVLLSLGRSYLYPCLIAPGSAGTIVLEIAGNNFIYPASTVLARIFLSPTGQGLSRSLYSAIQQLQVRG